MNGCACKLSSCLAEEDESWVMQSLTAVGESESLTAAGDCKNLLIVENEKSWDRCWGNQKLGLYATSRMRIFILLGSIRNSGYLPL